MSDLTLDDLYSYKYILKRRIKLMYPHLVEILITGPDTDQLFEYCYGKPPIAKIIVTLSGTPKNKKYGVLIFPDQYYKPLIINADNRGCSMKIEMYESICSWLKSIVTPFERQIQRTDTVKEELIQKGFIREFPFYNF